MMVPEGATLKTRTKRPVDLCFFVILLLGTTGCATRIETTVLAEKPVALGPEWIELTFEKPVTAVWRVQAVHLSTEDSLAAISDAWENCPEVELITIDGTSVTLEGCGLHLGGPESEIDKDSLHIRPGTSFVGLRMRSPRPLAVLRITWLSNAPEDFKAGVI